MITEDVYNNRIFESNASIAVYKELNDLLTQKAMACSEEAKALRAKGDENLSRDEFLEVTEKLAKSVAYLKFQKKLGDIYDKILKDIDRLMKLYKFQQGRMK